MSDKYQDFVLLSGVLSEDTDHNTINLPLSDNYTLLCNSYELSRGNKIVEVPTLSKNSIIELAGIGALTITTKGDVLLSENVSFISTINEISSRKVAFTLNIGTQSFENMLLKSYTAEIDRFGTRADCTLVFVQIL